MGPGIITWSGLLSQFEGFFRKLVMLLPTIEDITPAHRIMISIMKVPGIQQSKVSERMFYFKLIRILIYLNNYRAYCVNATNNFF